MKKISGTILLAAAFCLIFAFAGCAEPETKVSAEQWRNILNGFGTPYVSVSVRMTYETSERTEITTVNVDLVRQKSHIVEHRSGTYEEYYSVEDGKLYCYFFNDANKWEKLYEEKDFNDVLESYFSEFSLNLVEFKDYYDTFGYDEETNRYIVDDKNQLDKIDFNQYDKVICSFENGRLTYFQIIYRYSGEKLSFEIFDYDKTKVNLPKTDGN